MSTYLLAFSVSQFRNITKLGPIEFSVHASQTAVNDMQYALDNGIAAIQALEEYIGHNYTLKKMDFIAIDDFLMGAMVRFKTFCFTKSEINVFQENWGFVSYK